jgi:hypothetical protein
MSPLRGVTLAGLAKKYPKNGGVRKANCKPITTQYFIAYHSFTTTIDYWLQRAERLIYAVLPLG